MFDADGFWIIVCVLLKPALPTIPKQAVEDRRLGSAKTPQTSFQVHQNSPPPPKKKWIHNEKQTKLIGDREKRKKILFQAWSESLIASSSFVTR